MAGSERDPTGGTKIPPAMTTEVAPNPKKAAGLRRVQVLTLVYAEGRVEQGRLWVLDRGPYRIGRDPDAEGGERSSRTIALPADARASRAHAELRFERGDDGHRLVDQESRNGTFVDGQSITAAVLRHGSVVRIGSSVFVYSDVEVPVGLPLPDPKHGVALLRLVAEASADLAAPTAMPILITGPTGAGKEVLAQRIHAASERRGALVPVNCATFSRELIGSELFGHAAGAFSGAKGPRSGLFVAAAGGTLFLDEIAELPLDQQPALLRALQEGRVRPVGSDTEVEVDARVVAATHQSLDGLLDAGAFRSDLHARLAGFVIDLPGLAKRKEEILSLFVRFLGSDKPLTIEAAEALLLYDWPQNVRELKHAAERARLFLDRSDAVEPAALPAAVQKGPAEPREVEVVALDGEPTKEELEAILREHGGNVAQISRATGKHRQQIYRWIEKYGLDLDGYRPED
jgi:transcriptional regulator of acetoin/glycerol metabolism